MHYLDIFVSHYGWEGFALACAASVMLIVQLYYYLAVYGRVPGYKNNRRKSILDAEPPVSVVVPMFSENTAFIEETLPKLLGQAYPEFEIVVVYVGCDSDFYEDLVRLRQALPRLTTTKIEYNPRFPISVKMALNVGIKSARYEHIVFTTTDACPASASWIAMMAKGFLKSDIVLGYCGIEPARGFARRFMRTDRMMSSAAWIAAAVRRRPYRGIRHNLGITKSVYFGSNGFNCLNMNIGEDDLYMMEVMRPDNVSVILSPRAAVTEHPWGGLGWWTGRRRHFGSTFMFYPDGVKSYIRYETGSRTLFFLTIATALAFMPLEYKAAALVLLLVRYAAVAVTVNRLSKRLGEKGLVGRYFVYDMLSPLYDLAVRISMVRKDRTVWR
ncbi:MAG: glycosyltransferase [Alistipes sp.]|nr:glycosyltransferase [Alistipes sp.]